MKTYAVLFIAITAAFSFKCFGQSTNHTSNIAALGNTTSQSNNLSKDDLVIVAYDVEETINMAFGKRITKYEVSKLSMVNTYDLGPHNTRVVTPVYGKAKVKTVEVGMQSKAFVDTIRTNIKPIKVDVIAPAEARKYLTIDVIDTYEKVLDKGYTSLDMLIKVADRAYFDDDFAIAVKYYSQLFSLTNNLDSMYYYRYAQSLKGINQIEKADEMMKLFEIKNSAYKVVRE
ncbi:hypothetical protein ACHRVZ_08855 [Flavobacterium sp. FlaQc-57]|uniref:hypothetical protein n=1 Tax=Flavobacterium sp. FlaQc-57 TaxID=3374186 RepID=UPI003757FC13